MPYRSLHLQNFRSYADFTVEFSDGVNVIAGPNGSGKTNLLEALYVLSTGSSFRVADRDLTRHNAALWRLEAVLDDGNTRFAAYDTGQVLQPPQTAEEPSESPALSQSPPPAKPQKQFTLDGVKRARLGFEHKLPVVLFEPEHLRLLHGSPLRRRDYLDDLLSRLQPDYARLRARFERVLQQRNNLLKDASQHHRPSAWLDDQLFAWDISFADLAYTLVGRRQLLVARLNEQLAATYSRIAGRDSAAVMGYRSSLGVENGGVNPAYKSTLLTWLQTNRPHDIRRGYSGAGPHRDDLVIHLNGSDASLSASRGEIRTLVLALKMIEVELFADHSPHPPLLLFDDVFSELDEVRRGELARVAGGYQTIITTTDADSMLRQKMGPVINILGQG